MIVVFMMVVEDLRWIGDEDVGRWFYFLFKVVCFFELRRLGGCVWGSKLGICGDDKMVVVWLLIEMVVFWVVNGCCK